MSAYLRQCLEDDYKTTIPYWIRFEGKVYLNRESLLGDRYKLNLFSKIIVQNGLVLVSVNDPTVRY